MVGVVVVVCFGKGLERCFGLLLSEVPGKVRCAYNRVDSVHDFSICKENQKQERESE